MLSVVVVTFNMRREAPRTLLSLSPAYQRGVAADDYEVIVVDNGSDDPLTSAEVAAIAPNVRFHAMDDPRPSPARAANTGVALSRGGSVAIVLDGARMLTPGVLAQSLRGLRVHPRALVATLAWHLGPDHQARSVLQGYDQATEDRLLASIGWPGDGYRLFEIAAIAGSNEGGWFGPLAESCCLVLPRLLYDEMGGYDERFDLPGGGFANLDLFVRACELPDTELVVLLGEGTFHQLHGGVASNETAGVPREYWDQYARLRGRPFTAPGRERLYLGHVPGPALRWLEDSARRAGPA